MHNTVSIIIQVQPKLTEKSSSNNKSNYSSKQLIRAHKLFTEHQWVAEIDNCAISDFTTVQLKRVRRFLHTHVYTLVYFSNEW